MKVSIITAAFNSESTIRDTLQCITEQDYPEIEHIIVDGKSTDNTISVVKAFPHVAKIISEPDKGIYDAMNKGISIASGEIVGILNSDDIYTHSNVISKVAEIFKDSSVMALYADLQYVAANDLNKVLRSWKSGPFKRKNFYYGWMPPHPAFFVRKEMYNKYGLFNTSLRSAADYELMLRFLVKHEVTPVYLPEVIVKMRNGGISNANLRNRWRANREDNMAWKFNELKPYFFTVYLKPLRKISQFLVR
ncbi:glycosyltransferase [Panacibacter ginsenosidivorans]|uniref:Glycosyltransferase n=1 Tax=Panacibacter ginsenosidivorans TaxID=1813871 RepID=A0A5B8V926_9BACT|nr:glycosyltransferase family 2 protein [Panacibacter ginsenosidivorans]QEC68020.1 glycosyltransferase [Panacibacter ginsenosidivorans]